MRYRKLDADGDMVFGHAQNDFWRDVPDAPAQAAMTRLKLWLGEWFLDTTDGTPWLTKVLGKFTGSTRDAVIRARMAQTDGVNSIASYTSQVNRQTRSFTVQATLDTAYGGVSVNFALGLKVPHPGYLAAEDGGLITAEDGGTIIIE